MSSKMFIILAVVALAASVYGKHIQEQNDEDLIDPQIPDGVGVLPLKIPKGHDASRAPSNKLPEEGKRVTSNLPPEFEITKGELAQKKPNVPLKQNRPLSKSPQPQQQPPPPPPPPPPTRQPPPPQIMTLGVLPVIPALVMLLPFSASMLLPYSATIVHKPTARDYANALKPEMVPPSNKSQKDAIREAEHKKLAEVAKQILNYRPKKTELQPKKRSQDKPTACDIANAHNPEVVPPSNKVAKQIHNDRPKKTELQPKKRSDSRAAQADNIIQYANSVSTHNDQVLARSLMQLYRSASVTGQVDASGLHPPPNFYGQVGAPGAVIPVSGRRDDTPNPQPLVHLKSLLETLADQH